MRGSRKISVGVLWVIFMLAVPAALADETDELKWLTSMQEALEESERSRRPILMEINGRPWCPPCVAQEKNILSKAAFQEWARQHVVLLEIRVGDGYDRSSGHPEWAELMKKHQLQGIPAIVFLDSDQSEIGKLAPMSEVDAWLARADEILALSGDE